MTLVREAGGPGSRWRGEYVSKPAPSGPAGHLPHHGGGELSLAREAGGLEAVGVANTFLSRPPPALRATSPTVVGESDSSSPEGVSPR
jgi:hypothetical protein